MKGLVCLSPDVYREELIRYQHTFPDQTAPPYNQVIFKG